MNKSLDQKIQEAEQRTKFWAEGINNIEFPEVKSIEDTRLEETGVRRCFRCHSKFMPLSKGQVFCRDKDCVIEK